MNDVDLSSGCERNGRGLSSDSYNTQGRYIFDLTYSSVVVRLRSEEAICPSLPSHGDAG